MKMRPACDVPLGRNRNRRQIREMPFEMTAKRNITKYFSAAVHFSVVSLIIYSYDNKDTRTIFPVHFKGLVIFVLKRGLSL